MRPERKVPEKLRTNSRFLLHDNAPAHWTVSVKDFLSKKNVTTLEHSPYSPDLAAAHLYLFPRPRLALMRRRFCDSTDIIKNATEELKRLSQNFSSNVSNTFTAAGPNAYLHNGIT
jgi:transposase